MGFSMKFMTVIPRGKDRYAAFPTFTEFDNKIYIFYREGIKSDFQCHGLYGKVKCFIVEKSVVRNLLNSEEEDAVYRFGKEFVLFEGENELDAIVSRPEKNLYTLATRSYVKGKKGSTYISVSDIPEFSERREVVVSGVLWLVLYGKCFKHNNGYIFSAYGVLNGEKDTKPLILYTENFVKWELFSYITIHKAGAVLNESSILCDGESYRIFIREDSEPYGIWCSTSQDLRKWTFPEKLLSAAHAPMALYLKEKVYLAYRKLITKEESGIALRINDNTKSDIHIIDTYRGSPYDGGYSDIGIIDNFLLIFYYLGNEGGEPFIKLAYEKIDI